MKTKAKTITNSIKMAVEEMQTLSYHEFERLLPEYIATKGNIRFDRLDNLFLKKTGMSIKDYFNEVKSAKAGELLEHYRLSPIEAAYQLGFKTANSLRRMIKEQRHYRISPLKFPRLNKRTAIVPEYT